MLLGCLLDRGHLFGRRLGNALERRPLSRIHGHAVLNVHAEFGHLARNLVNVTIVHSRDDDRVDLDHSPVGLERLYGFELPAQQQFRRP